MEKVSGNTYNADYSPDEIFKVSDTKYNIEPIGEFHKTFEFSIDGSTLTLHEPDSYNEDVVLTKKQQ